MPRLHAAAIALVALLGACAELTAEAPLFSVADQAGPAPLTEGVWIAVGEGCSERNVQRRRFPSACGPMDIRRDEDGAWRVVMRADLVSDLTGRELEEAEAEPSNGPYRVIIAPAVERQLGESYAPLYLAELQARREEGVSVGYAVIAPIGAMPATEMRLMASLGCTSILRDGPIDGVTPQYETRTDADGVEYQEITGCVASTQTAVRAAARRAVIEHLDTLADRRFVLTRVR